MCHQNCLVCSDKYYTTCTLCVNFAALIQNNALCLSTFPNYTSLCYANDQCVTSCPSQLYFWLPQNQTTNAAYSWTYNGAANLRQTNVCYLCHERCLVCTDQYYTTCSVCTYFAALVQNNALCTSTFPNDPYCYADNQCLTACPTNLYFWLPLASTSNSSYQFTYSGPSNLRLTNVCYLCHKYCLTCTDQYDNTCTSCAFSYFYWNQQAAYPNRCNYYCK